MVKQINLYEAKTNLSRLVDEAAGGEEIVIAKNGEAKARLVPVLGGKLDARALGQWSHLLTPEQTQDLGSEAWWRRWKEADLEIEHDFALGLEEPGGGFESQWPATSSTRTPSSGQKQVRAKYTRRRSRK
jgi:prevent-host-death family protein